MVKVWLCVSDLTKLIVPEYSWKALHINSLLTGRVEVKVILRRTVSRDPWPVFLLFFLEIISRHLRVCYYGAPSLTRGRVCNLQLLLGLTSAVFLGSEFHGESWPNFIAPNLTLPESGRPGSLIYFSQDQVAQLHPQALVSFCELDFFYIR
jgi:hypothetical protein